VKTQLTRPVDGQSDEDEWTVVDGAAAAAAAAPVTGNVHRILHATLGEMTYDIACMAGWCTSEKDAETRWRRN